MKSHKILAAILILQIVSLLNQWFGSPVNQARAQIPDTGAQNVQIIDELKTSNEHLKSIDDKMDKLVSILESGKVQTPDTKPDENQQK